MSAAGGISSRVTVTSIRGTKPKRKDHHGNGAVYDQQRPRATVQGAEFLPRTKLERQREWQHRRKAIVMLTSIGMIGAGRDLSGKVGPSGRIKGTVNIDEEHALGQT